MVGNESTRKSSDAPRYPDRLQQILNRLHKRYEHLSFEESKQRVVRDIEQMQLSDADREALLRRLD